MKKTDMSQRSSPAGTFLKFVHSIFRIIQLGASCVILGIYSYFLATLHNHYFPINTYLRSVEGISGVGVCYTAICILGLCCVGGFRFRVLAWLAVLLDITFTGAYAYVVWETREGAQGCTGYVKTPFGNGDSNVRVHGLKEGGTALPSLHQACKLQTAAFSVSIIATFFFLISAFSEIALWKHNKSERKWGPSPANNYTEGSKRSRGKFWRLGRHHDEGSQGSWAEDNPSMSANAYPMTAKGYRRNDATRDPEEGPYSKYGNSSAAGNSLPARNQAGYESAVLTGKGGPPPPY